MSQEQVLKTLVDLGFDELEARIYFLLSKKGASKASDICKVLRITKQQFYPNVKQLEGKGIVTSTIEHPARFSAMCFEKVLDLFIKERLQEARRLQQSRSEILSNWQNVSLEDETPAKFSVIQGRACIFNKMQQMIEESKDQILAITTVPALAQANERDVFDSMPNRQRKPEVRLRFLTELSEQNARLMKSFLKDKVANKRIESRTPELCPTSFPHMLLRDEEEVLFFINPRTQNSIIEKTDLCMWTDCQALVKSFKTLFEDAWRCSMDVEKKMFELESGTLLSKSILISDAETSEKQFYRILKGAKEEILAIVSSKGLDKLMQELSGISYLAKEGVPTRIMAPIMENDDKMVYAPNSCSIRHVIPNYRQTIIVDGKYLFQFGIRKSGKIDNDSFEFENVMFITSPDYVSKTKQMLEEIWNHANPPSTENLKSLFGDGGRSQSAYFPGAIRSLGPSGTFYPSPVADPSNKNTYRTIEVVNDDPDGKLTEQDILKEIIEGQKSHSPSVDGSFRIYSTQGIALIHPPSNLELPSMLIRIHHIEKQSTFGEENAIIINTPVETPTGPAYIPVAVVSDNPNAQNVWGRHFPAFPVGQNIHIMNQGELKVGAHGNTLFAAWTLPIPLYSEHALPPSCLLLEGYGDVKTEAYTIVQPTGGKFKAKQNGLDAFVTFMHPASKYSGAGTDGFLVRDFAMEVTPQFIEGFHPTRQVRLVKKDKR